MTYSVQSDGDPLKEDRRREEEPESLQLYRDVPEPLAAEWRNRHAGDDWSECMAWLFAIADFLTDFGDGPPREWDYRRAVRGSDKEAWEYCALELMHEHGEIDLADVHKFGAYLWKLRSELKEAGEDY